MKDEKTDATSNFKHQTSNLSTVRLKKSHPCGGNEFTVIREGPMVTLRCLQCGSFVRMSREKYEKSVKEKEKSDS
jgi:hypothetical protein